MFRKTVIGLIALLLVAATWGLAAQPAGAATGPPLARVTILSTAHLMDGGAAIAARLLVRCRPNGTDGIQWEGFVNATQGDVFAWAELPLVCDGRPHVEHVVLPVSAPPGTASFAPGTAEVTAVIMDENTLVQYAGDARTVKVVAVRCHGMAAHARSVADGRMHRLP